MKTNFFALMTLASSLAAPLPLLAQGCGDGASTQHACAMPGMTPTADSTANPAQPAAPALDKSVQAVFDNYIKLQAALVQDSLEGVSGAGSALAKALPGVANQSLPADVTTQAESIAKAKDYKP